MGFWSWLWKSNSLLSWIVFLILTFVFVRFVFFPVSGLILNSKIPFVIIESRSMEHEGNFDKWFALHGAWYERNNITKEEILEYWPFKNGLNKGDIVIVRGCKEYKKGDVIIFRVEGKKVPIIHRVVNRGIINETNKTFYSTKGDRNDGQLPQEILIIENQIIGKAIARIPYLGWIKLIFFEIFKK